MMRPFARFALATHALPLAALAVPAAAPALLAAWAAAQAGITALILNPRSGLFARNILRGDASSNRAALSFDDGPREGETERLLDLLAAEKTRVTFFFIGDRARRLPGLVKRAASEGHEVANHSLSHPPAFALLGRKVLKREIGEAQSILSDITGTAPRFFRPPVGHKNLFLDEALAEHGLSQVCWSLRSFDTVLRDARRVQRRVLGRVRGGDIVLLHEGLTDRRTGSPLSLEVVGAVIRGLRGSGIEPVSLPALPAAFPGTPAAGSSRRPAGP